MKHLKTFSMIKQIKVIYRVKNHYTSIHLHVKSGQTMDEELKEVTQILDKQSIYPDKITIIRL